jgi:hypothetical protein
MKGFRTVLYGLAVATVPSALVYLGGVDWTQFGISPSVAAVIGAGIVGFRAYTTTAIGSKN